MSKPYLAMYVADYIIDYCNKHDIEINNLKLQKVMYYLQAKSLVETNEPLIDEELQKWKYGPVVPTVYHEYKNNGAGNIGISDIGPILRKARVNEKANFLGRYVQEEYSSELIEQDDRNSINEVVNSLSDYTGFELVNETHGHSIWKNEESRINAGEQGIKYTNEEIKIFFSKNKGAQLWKQA
ncbi:Panacea domain-containing protein [Enterococcus faecalis]|uniref:Panacea domain-containing protein n=1 Tax=Enterococcus faecalis TaxID=1351 RepID=UPI00242B659D|nr:type II toxin-antitoxin system antitoxin SocA domain-containing protein [Enterococcus faecalis]